MFIINFNFNYFFKYSHIHKKNTTNNFAKFRGLKTDIGYNFTIYSTNKKGRSVEYSIINVPSETNSKSIIHIPTCYLSERYVNISLF